MTQRYLDKGQSKTKKKKCINGVFEKFPLKFNVWNSHRRQSLNATCPFYIHTNPKNPKSRVGYRILVVLTVKLIGSRIFAGTRTRHVIDLGGSRPLVREELIGGTDLTVTGTRKRKF